MSGNQSLLTQVFKSVAATSLLFVQAINVNPAQAQMAKPVFVDGQAQIVPAFADSKEWIHEHLWVETEFDSDHDGKKDRVHVDVTRQKQTETEGLRVAVVYQSSPYFAGTANGGAIMWNVRQELGDVTPPRTSHPSIAFEPNRTVISNSLVSTWVPRGFAVVHSEAPGTGLSQGSVTVGGAPERLAPKAVIDWLNGRAKGYTTADGNVQVFAKWCTGKVGMTGTSYEGTLPVAAATGAAARAGCASSKSSNPCAATERLRPSRRMTYSVRTSPGRGSGRTTSSGRQGVCAGVVQPLGASLTSAQTP